MLIQKKPNFHHKHTPHYEQLVNKINIGRETETYNTINRFNMDNGNNFFKATLSIVDLTEEETASPKTSGVNMIIPLAVVPDIAENYANVSKVVKISVCNIFAILPLLFQISLFDCIPYPHHY